eukprot:GHVR01032732.1.p1 GENE.GHVR01032732.1~~GHVR01032732.1.p1  ORF type:complete len:263 (-),score=94.40 GHVR01032732.1:41-829(-)
MSGYWKPGDKHPSVTHDLDIESSYAVYNKCASLPLSEQRRRLPVAARKHDFLWALETHTVVIFVAHTGSGKSTQLPLYMFEGGWTSHGRGVCVTQPRRLAAQTVAARVAAEINCELGSIVGYSVRFEDMTSSETRVKFVTDGLLIREMLSDPLLSTYSVIMIDDAHDRSIASDLLLGLLKKIIRKRKDLRIVISSATLDAQMFVDFFSPSVICSEKESRWDKRTDNTHTQTHTDTHTDTVTHTPHLSNETNKHTHTHTQNLN